MNNIKEYILEKLHISKNYKVDSDKVDLALQFVEEYIDYAPLRILNKWLDKHKGNTFDVFANIELNKVSYVDKKYYQIEYNKDKLKEILDRTDGKSWRLVKNYKDFSIGYMEDIFFIRFPYIEKGFHYFGTIYIKY